MNESQVRTLEQVREVVAGTQALQFSCATNDDARYAWVAGVLKRFAYGRLGRADRGLIRAYVQSLSGYSRAQVTRLIARWRNDGRLVKRYRAPAHAFAQRYTAEDVVRLAEVDRAMDTLSGPATACILHRQFTVFGDARFVRLASISSAHIYNLRYSDTYLRQRVAKTVTRPAKTSQIGERRAPRPAGRPGFIRIDSVHQGDLDGIKGLYHINAVDCVTQWQIVASVAGLSEAFLFPVIEDMLAQFPFALLGFHADNGSEYVNHRVAALLDKLHAEFTRSRPRHSNDNGLAETKNGAVVRKVFGYAHIPQPHAQRFNDFCREHLNPFLNFHRPCLFATERADPAKPGRIKRIYRHQDVMTPFAKLSSLPGAAACLREGITLDGLSAQALACSDLQAAQAMQSARQALFRLIQRRSA